MTWNIAPECISAVILCIIWVYSRKGSPLPTLKNFIFQGCFCVTFVAMVSNITSTLCIYYVEHVPLLLSWLVTIVYFIATPLMGIVYFCYTAANIYEEPHRLIRFILPCSAPALLYLLLVLLNPVTNDLFSLSRAQGYRQGPYIILTYLVFYIYCLASVVLVLVKSRTLEPQTRRILASFPVIAGLVIVVQLFIPSIILTGSAATCAMLLIYLYIQNKQLSIDHLTGFANRREFLNMLELKARQRVQREFTVVVMSLAGFKQINDLFGQLRGDAFLQSVSSYLLSVTTRSRLYRFSGDEFALLLDGADVQRALDLVHTIQKRMESPWTAKSYSCMLGAVYGVASFPHCSDTTQGLVGGLEYAIMQAKLSPGGVCVCDAEMLSHIKRKQQIIQVLEQELQAGGFSICYQPILSVGSSSFYKAEALLRIESSPLGPLYPNEFIPIAEETGLIIAITYLVLEKVCMFVRHLLDEGIPIQWVSINFSPLQFTQKDLVERVCAIIDQCGIPMSCIKIEITESTLAQSQQVVNDFITAMHARDILIGLDDFGTGYSNLVSVMNTHIDTVKLDKSLVWSAVDSPKSSLVVRNLTRMFLDLNMVVLAEGVETEQQSVFVRECGCALIQGYLYSKPLPMRQFEQFIQRAAAAQK